MKTSEVSSKKPAVGGRFFELKSKVDSLEKQLKQASEENKKLIQERDDAERKESKYRSKQKRAREQSTKKGKEAHALIMEKVKLENQVEELKDELEAEIDAHAADLEEVEVRLEAKDTKMANMKKVILAQKKKLQKFEKIQEAIEKNKLMMETYQVQLTEKRKVDALRQQLMKNNFEMQVKEALIIGQEQGRQLERKRVKVNNDEEWKKLLEKEKEFEEDDEALAQMAANAIALEHRTDTGGTVRLKKPSAPVSSENIKRILRKKKSYNASQNKRIINAEFNGKGNQFKMEEPLSLQKLAEIRSLLSEVRKIGSGQNYEILHRHAMEGIVENNKKNAVGRGEKSLGGDKILSNMVRG
jgi:chromosome segregation ATPase